MAQTSELCGKEGKNNFLSVSLALIAFLGLLEGEPPHLD